MKHFNKLLILINQDLSKNKKTIGISFMLYIVFTTIYKFSIIHNMNISSMFNISYIWILFFYNSLQSIILFFFYSNNKLVEFYQIRPYYLYTYIYSQIIVFNIINITPLIIFLPFFFIFLNITYEYIWILIGIFIYSNITISLIGIWISLLINFLLNNYYLIIILIFPLLIPNSIFTINVIHSFIQNSDYLPQIFFLLIYNLLLIIIIKLTLFFLKK